MNRMMKGIIAGFLLLVGAVNANAGTINFTNCWSNCMDALGVSNGTSVGTVATLDFTQNGDDVDFVLTNLFSSYDATEVTVFLSQLFFNTFSAPSDIINLSNNIQDITLGAITNAGLQFDVLADFDNANNGPNGDRILNGDTASWTFTDFSEADVLLPAMVHFQGFANGESVKIVDGGTIIDNPSGVPEPGMLLLFGSGLIALGWSRKRKAKA